MLKKVLKNIGFSDKEAEIYLLGIKLGPQSAANIARNTKIPRPSVYDILKNLSKRGIVSQQKKSDRTLFIMISPENLINFLEREKENFIQQKEREKNQVLEILPALKSIELKHLKKPKVEFFEGEKGLQQAYERTLKSKNKTIRAYANVKEMHKTLPNFFPQYYVRRTEKNIKINTIMPDNKESINRQKKDSQELRKSKIIHHKDFEFTPEINIFDNTVLYASWKEKMAILIESEEIADFHKKMFDLLWKKL